VAVIVPLLTFASVLLLCSGGYWLFVVRPERHHERTLFRRLGKAQQVHTARAARLLKDARVMSTVAAFDSVLQHTRGRAAWVHELLEQSGTATTVGRLVLACGCLAGVGLALIHHLTGSLLFAVVAAVAMAYVPIAALRYKRTLRLRKFEEQFPEALDLLSRALRAGHSFTTGIEMVAEEMPKPLGPEFKLLYDQQNYGMAMPDALTHFAQRIPVLDARFFVTAVLIQRESGGNLSEVLDNLAGVMRDRFKVKRQMRVVSAHGRITGWVLVALPPVLGAALMTINREHRDIMLGDPLGQKMLIAAVVMQIVGALVIRKIVDVEY
jgi:tight adherence protein B